MENSVQEAISYALNHRFPPLMGRPDISLAEHNQIQEFARLIASDAFIRFYEIVASQGN